MAAAAAAPYAARPPADLAAHAAAFAASAPEDALAIYTHLLRRDDADAHIRESALAGIADLHAANADAHALANVLMSEETVAAVLDKLPKARAAKLVRALLDRFDRMALPSVAADVPSSVDVHHLATCKHLVAWSSRDHARQFLLQHLETRLAALHLRAREYPAALAILARLLSSLKKLDDRLALVEVHLLESRVYHALRNLPKARAALTAARAAANSVYTPPHLQAQLDLQSGVLHVEDRDFVTAQSYFLEALEGFATHRDALVRAKATPIEAQGAPEAAHRMVQVIKYLALCKVMLQAPEEVESVVLRGKHAERALDTSTPDAGIEAVRQVARAQAQGSLREFEAAMTQHGAVLKQDPVVSAHLATLYDQLLERNLLRAVMPYSRVQLHWVAQQVKLPEPRVEAKLSQMILDGVLRGVLDHADGCLVVFEDEHGDGLYTAALEAMRSMGAVVDSLYDKAAKLA